MKDKVSIIIPSYNSEKYINRCIDSALEQTYKNIEIIVIDDGSTDNSEKKYNEYSKNSAIKIIKQKNSGPSSARNTGIDYAEGKYIFFMDIDDYIDKECIEKLIECNSKSPQNTIISLKHRIVSANNSTNCNYNNMYSLDEARKNILLGKMRGVIWGILLERDIIKQKSIKFDTNTSLIEDTMFLFEYFKHFNSIQYIEEYYNYYISETSITTTKDIERVKKNILDSFYSTEKLNLITDSTYQNELIRTELRLLRYEFKKVGSFKKLNIVLKDERVRNKLHLFIKKNKLKIFSNILLRYNIVYILYSNKRNN